MKWKASESKSSIHSVFPYYTTAFFLYHITVVQSLYFNWFPEVIIMKLLLGISYKLSKNGNKREIYV